MCVGFVIGLVIALLFGFWAMSIAQRKGYSGGFFWLGFFFPLVGVIIAACLSDKTFESSYEAAPPSYGFLDRDSSAVSAPSPYASLGARDKAPQRTPAKASAPQKPRQAEGTKWTTCSTCGKRVTRDYARIRKRCPDCGAPYDLEFAEPEAEAAEAPEESKSDGFDSRMEAPAEAPPEEERACGRCDKANQPSARFCMYCGAPKQADWACPACGAQNPPVAKYCMMCGTQKEG